MIPRATRTRLACIALAVLAAAVTACGDPAPPDRSAVHKRFVAEVDHDDPWAEFKLAAGTEFRNVLFGTAHSERRELAIAKDGTIAVSEIFAGKAPGDRVAALAVAADVGAGPRFHRVPVPADRSEWEAVRLRVVDPEGPPVAREELLANRSFEDFPKGFSIQPWEIAGAPGEIPIAAPKRNIPGDVFLLELKPQGNYLTRARQTVRVERFAPGGNANLLARVIGFADERKALQLQVSRIGKGRRTKLGVVEHPGDSRWRELALEFEIAAEDLPVTLELDLLRPAGASGVVRVNEASLGRLRQTNPETATVWAREIVSEFLTDPVTLPPEARLEFGMGLIPGWPSTITGQWAELRHIDSASSQFSSPDVARFQIFVDASGRLREIFSRKIGPTPQGWVDARVDLSEFAGQRLRFAFKADVGAGAVDRNDPDTFSPIWANPVLRSAGRRPERPNLILISLDTLRADHLGAYGYERETSPHFDRLAENAVLFERCIAPSSWTSPSHATVFTGLPQMLHLAGSVRAVRLREGVTTLAEIARQRGYATAAFTDGGAVSSLFGFSQGFDSYSDGTGKLPTPPGSAGRMFRRAEAWLEDPPDVPFLLFLHTYEIHHPYKPPRKFRNRFIATDVESVAPRPQATPEEREIAIGLYDAGIAYTDAELGRFMDELESTDILDNTIVIVFSDHGEEFWDHDQTTHAMTLYEEQLHVPLLVRLPGSNPPSGRIERQVALADIFATAVELLDFDIHRPGDSLSLLPLIDPESNDSAYERDLVTSELFQKMTSTLLLSARSRTHKYIAKTVLSDTDSPLHPFIRSPGRIIGPVMERQLLEHLSKGGAGVSEELFELLVDPREQHDLAPGDADAVAKMRAELDAALDGVERDVAEFGSSEDLAPLTQQEREMLEALGYL